MVFEVVADFQKSAFRNDPANKVTISGLFSASFGRNSTKSFRKFDRKNFGDFSLD